MDLHISEGYTRKRHWEIVYHDLMDLYGPMIGPDGIGMWLTYKRYVQNDPEHILEGRAWPSHRSLADLYGCGRKRLHSARKRLTSAGLITVTRGSDLGMDLSDIARLGIQNPANTLFIEVNDPLEFDDFCAAFFLAYSPVEHNGRWDMKFDDYEGRILGNNRLLAAAAYIEEHITDVTEEQIRSLLRCSEDDRKTIGIRNRLINRHRQHSDETQRRVSTLPDTALAILRRLGWQGPLDEVEELFAEDSELVWEQLDYWLKHRNDVDNPAAALRQSLRYGSLEPAEPLEELEF
jgi:hypothetical protein